MYKGVLVNYINLKVGVVARAEIAESNLKSLQGQCSIKMQARVAKWYIGTPEILIGEYFGRPFGIFPPFVCCTLKNLATLVQTSFQLCTVKAPKNTFQVDTI
jgi:hypothetical protein